MDRPKYRGAVAVLLAGLGLSFICLSGILVTWGLLGTSDSTIWSEIADQALTWAGIEHTIGTGDSGVSGTVWTLSIILGLGIGVGLLMATYASCVICWRALREPRVRQTTSQGVTLSKDLSKRGLSSGQRLHSDLKDRWRRRGGEDPS